MIGPRRWARLVLLVATAGVALATIGASPVAAQQIIDAGGGEGEGGVAFVAFTIMVVLVAGSLFYMDRIRRRRDERERARGPQPPN